MFPASVKGSELIPIDLNNAIGFGAKLEKHIILGFNSIIRKMNSNMIDTIIVSHLSPSNIIQMIFENVQLHNALLPNEKINMCIVNGACSKKIIEMVKVKRFSCLAVWNQKILNGAVNTELSESSLHSENDHIIASLDALKSTVQLHSNNNLDK